MIVMIQRIVAVFSHQIERDENCNENGEKVSTDNDNGGNDTKDDDNDDDDNEKNEKLSPSPGTMMMMMIANMMANKKNLLLASHLLMLAVSNTGLSFRIPTLIVIVIIMEVFLLNNFVGEGHLFRSVNVKTEKAHCFRWC